MTTIFIKYVYWHFTIAPLQIMVIMTNYLRAFWHRFLIGQHFKTLFAPWHRQEPSQLAPKRSKNFVDKILDFIADIYIRLIAATIRLSVIIAGLVTQLFIALGFTALFLVWIIWPVLAIYLIFRGLSLVYGF